MAKKIVIVGAGPGGLSAGMLLASRNFDVTIVEKEAVPGGRNAGFSLGPYKFDLGPTFLMMKFVLEDVFRESGRKIEDYLKIIPLEPMYRLEFVKKSVDIYSDHAKTRDEIERAFPGNGKGVDLFISKEQKKYQYLLPCLQTPYMTPGSLVNQNIRRAFPHLPVVRSLYSVMGDYFDDERARLSFTFQSKYLGMSPWDCPGIFTIIPYIEHSMGIYHVEGGLSEISNAMAKVCLEHGCRIRYGATVKNLVLTGRKVRGVRLMNNEVIKADSVVINADFGYAMSSLVPKGVLKRWSRERLMKKGFSCSTFMMYLGLKKDYGLKHHTIVFAQDYRQNLEDVRLGRASDDISMYVRNATVTDKSLAPEGHSALYILVPVANNKAGLDWNDTRHMRRLVIAMLKKRLGLKDIEEQIAAERIITPADWEGYHNVFVGATFNLAHNLLQMLYFRPHNEFEELDNCYLVGGGTHPGSGLPTIYESARISSRLICERFGANY